MLGTGARIVVAVSLLASFLMTGAPARAGAVVDVTISNFHYCEAEICTFANQAYVRPKATGPVLKDIVVNPLGTIEVRRGDDVKWTYRDTTWCNLVNGCPGHDVVFEDGTVRSQLLKAREADPQTFTWTVPQSASPGAIILYYCSLPGPNQYMGHTDVMTGALKIVA